jgi:hypothetical protein
LPRLAAALVIAAPITAMVGLEPAAAVEATATQVDAVVAFGTGCSGTGSLRVFDPEGRQFGLDAESDRIRDIHWLPGTRIHVVGLVQGAAQPRIELTNDVGERLFDVALTPWGFGNGGIDRITVSCADGAYAALADTAMPPPRRLLGPVGLMSLIWLTVSLVLVLDRLRRFRHRPDTGQTS